MKRIIVAGALLVVTPVWAADVSVDGTLHDKGGNPLAGTQVELQDGPGVIVKKTTSDAQGHYQFTAVPIESFVLLAMDGNAVLGSALLTVFGAGDVHKDLNLA